MQTEADYKLELDDPYKISATMIFDVIELLYWVVGCYSHAQRNQCLGTDPKYLAGLAFLNRAVIENK